VTKSTRNQQSYTEGILVAAGHDPSDYSQYIKIWWWNHTDPISLRLSKSGLQFIKKFTKIPIHSIPISHPLLSTHLIKLARIDLGPYYLIVREKDATIMVLDQEVATMLMLHAGNLGQYLENLQL